jgi:hypothetical protein
VGNWLYRAFAHRELFLMRKKSKKLVKCIILIYFYLKVYSHEGGVLQHTTLGNR